MALNVSGGPLEFVADIDNNNFGIKLKQMENQIKGLTQTANQQSKAMEGVASKAALAIGSYLSVTTASNFLNQIINVRGEFQKLEAVLTNSLGSNDLAKSALGMISDYAAKTPFQLTEVANAYVKLVNQGFKPTTEELTSLGDLAASTGKDFGMLTEAILDAQQFEGERLKEFGIRMEQNGDKLKLTFRGQSTEIDKTSEAVTRYILGLGKLEGVAGSTAAISQTLVGQVSNLQDAFDRMLNEIGQGSEGAISGAVSGVTFLIENYQKVIDLIKVLILTYGSYKAALIVTTSLTKGYTIAETLRYQAMLISERATKLLNASMIATPAGAVAVAIGVLASAYFLLKDSATSAEKAQQAVNDVQLEAAKAIDQEKRNLEALLTVARDETRSKEEREAAMRKINAISPEYLSNLTLEKLKTEEGEKAINAYIEALSRKSKAQAASRALDRINDRRLELASERAGGKNSTFSTLFDVAMFPTIGSTALARGKELRALDEQEKALKDTFLKNITEELTGVKEGEAGKQEAKKKTLAVIDAEIKAVKEDQIANSTNAAEYQAQQKKINELEKERQAIAGASKAQVAAVNKENTKANQILERRKALLEEIKALQRDATQSGLVKEQTEIDRVNEKYEALIKKVEAFNKTVKDGQKISIKDLKVAQATEVKNVTLKQTAEGYKKSLDEQKTLFAQYEESKKQVGEDKANELYAIQTKGYISYQEFLFDEQKKLQEEIAKNGINVGVTEQLKAVNTEIVENQNVLAAKAIEQNEKDFSRVLQLTQSAADERRKIEEQYLKDVAALNASFKGEDLANRLKFLKETRDQDLTDLDNNLARQSQLYQTLNQDIIRFTRQQLKDRLKLLQQYIKDGYVIESNGKKTVITPQMKADLQNQVNSSKDFLNSTAEIFGLSVDKLKDISAYANLASNSFGQMAEAIRPFNKEIASTLDQLSDAASVTSNALTSVAGFASGDIASGVSGAVGALTGILKIFAESKQSKEAAAKQMLDFNKRILDAEFEITLQYRERLRVQKDTNDLRLDGIKKEQALLDKQKKQNDADYKRIFDQIQNESFVSGQRTEKSKGNPLFGLVGYLTGFGGKTKVVDELSSLAGKSFADLEKLFLSGQLTDRAKELFTQLQKLKQEGADIDAAIEQAKKAAQQVYTGTTSDSILDNIVQGFADGKRATADFAQDFENLMKGAILNALKYQTLEKPLKEFYDKFAELSESGGTLTQAEIDRLQQMYNGIITSAGTQFDQLQQLTGVNFNSATGAGNSLAGAIKGMTAQQADLLAGQFGGLRLTAIDQLRVAQSSMLELNKIQLNTGAMVVEMQSAIRFYKKWDTTGLKVV